MELPSGDFVEPTTKPSALDTGDWKPLATSLDQKQPSTVLSDSIEENVTAGNHLTSSSLGKIDDPAWNSIGKLVELCVPKEAPDHPL